VKLIWKTKWFFEPFQDCFHPKDLASGFPQWFQLCFHIAQGHNPPQITHIFGAARLLTMTKPSSGVCSITMGETLYQFIIYTLCIQFHEASATHFSHTNLWLWRNNPWHQMHLGPSPWLGCPSVRHGNTFNPVSKGVIFQELRALGGDII
jgi:hypothetical protein